MVIVGGGTMGASLAYFLTREGAWGAGKKVVVVEGRDVGSGASGRNGVSGYPSFRFPMLMHGCRDTSDHQLPRPLPCTSFPSVGEGQA